MLARDTGKQRESEDGEGTRFRPPAPITAPARCRSDQIERLPTPHHRRGRAILRLGRPTPPHICLIGPGDRFPTHPPCNPPTAIGVITERASATDFSLVHHVARAGHNVTTLTGLEIGRSDRTSSTGWRGVLLKPRIEIELWQLSWPELGRSSNKGAMEIL